MLRKDIPDGNTPLTVVLVNRTCRLIRDLTQVKLLTTLMTEICRWGHSIRHEQQNILGNLSASSHRPRKKYSSFPLKNIKLLVPTPPSFSARAHFWWFNLQQLYLICSNFLLFAARFYNLRQLYFICSNLLIWSMSLVGYRKDLVTFTTLSNDVVFPNYTRKFTVANSSSRSAI